MLEKLTAAPHADPFAWYGLAMEYRSLGRMDDCLRTFETLRQREPSYVPMYLMAGQVLIELHRNDDARVWVQAGLEQARRKGDNHAHSELEDLMARL